MTLLAGLAIVSCSKDDDKGGNGNCVTCDEFTQAGITLPAEEVCKGDNGNAFIEGEDSGMSYDQYLQVKRAFTTCD